MVTQAIQQDGQSRREGDSGSAALTPEEDAKSKAFFDWLAATACQLGLDADEQSQRKELYEAVACLRPNQSMDVIIAVQEAVTQWAYAHSTDPLNPTLNDCMEARRKEARLWSDLNITLANA